MKNLTPKYKIFILLFILFLLDLLRPFHYDLYAEFLFLGIIFTALNHPPSFSVSMALIFGYFKDAFFPSAIPFNMIEFLIVVILIQIFKYPYPTITGRSIIAASAIILHILLNTLNTGGFYPIFSILFLIHSVTFFIITNAILRKCMNICPVNYI